MQRVLRFLLVCFLAAAMPLKGMAVVLPLSGGFMPTAEFAKEASGQAVQVGQGDVARGVRRAHTAMAHMPHMPHMGHMGHMTDGTHGQVDQTAGDGRLGGPHVRSLRSVPAAQATHCPWAATDHAAELHKAPATTHGMPKCSACDACAAAAPLPAQPPRVVPPDFGPARFQPLALAPVCFVTGVPDRPPRHTLA